MVRADLNKKITISLLLILLFIGIGIWCKCSRQTMEKVDGGCSACRFEKGTILEIKDETSIIVNVDSPSWLYNKVLDLHYKDGYEWDDLKVGQKIKFYFPRSVSQDDVELDVYRTDIIE